MVTRAAAQGGGGGTLSSNPEGHGASAQEMVVFSPTSEGVAELAGDCASRQGHCSVTLPYRQSPPETQRFTATWQGALPKNFYIITACILGCALTILIGILVPMLVIRRSANLRNAVLRAKEHDAVSAWASVLRDVMIEGFAAARALAGYSISTFPPLQTPTNTSEPMPGDQITAYLGRFPRFASLIASKKSAVALQAICPSGVIAMTYPHDPGTVGRNLMSPSDPTNRYKPSTIETAQSGRYAIVGPRRTTITSLKRIWVIFTRAPLYRNTSQGVIPSLETFWGFVLLIVNVTGALDAMDLGRLAKANNLNFVLYDTSTESGNTHVIASSLPSATTQLDYAEFIAESTVTDILAPHSSLHIAVRSRETYVSLTPTNIIIIVAWTLFGSLLLLGIAIAAVLWCTATYDAAAHAPKMAPFAMLTIGPCRGEELWDLAVDQMAEVTEKLDQVLGRQMERHCAYQIQQVHPLTTSYVTRSVAAAVQMAFSTIEELQRHPIDGPLRAVLGDEGRLLLSYAVHWCTDAAVRVESLEGTYRYEGCDVVFGGRMWALAAPNVVTASEAVVQTLPRFGLCSIDTRSHCVVNVVRSRTLCGTTGGKGFGGKSATIHVPYSPPTTVQATAGARGGRDISPMATPMGGSSDIEDAQPLPPQQLFTLLDTRRPALVAAAAAAPHNANSFSASCPSDTAVASAMDLPAGERVILPVSSSSTADGGAATSPDIATAARTSASSHAPTESEGNDVFSAPSLSVAPPLSHASSSLDIGVPNGGATTAVRRNFLAFQGDAVTRALLQPLIPRALDVALRVAFDYQSITLDVRYAEVRVLVYYFYSSYKILFRPLAAPERHNIFRRLVTAFGVPQQGILEHLAARCVIRYVQQRLKSRRLALQPPHLRASPRETPLTQNVYANFGRASR